MQHVYRVGGSEDNESRVAFLSFIIFDASML